MQRHTSFLALLLLAGCASTTTQAPPEASATAPAPPAAARPELTNDIHWVRNAAEHRAVFHQTYHLAWRQLETLAEGRAPDTWAVALDADETVISNSRYQKELHESGASFSRDSWNAWVRRREATAQPGAREFLERIRELGGRIAIVTNRREEVCDDTRADFRSLELPFDVILCRTDERRKEPRWEAVRQGTASPDLPALEILMWLGDNIEDFPEWGQEKRGEADDAFADFGTRYFVLPNPMYGSWQGNPKQ